MPNISNSVQYPWNLHDYTCGFYAHFVHEGFISVTVYSSFEFQIKLHAKFANFAFINMESRMLFMFLF